MNRRHSLRLLLALVLTAATSTASAEEEASPNGPVNFFGTNKEPLLYITRSWSEDADGFKRTDQSSAFIFRDGTVLGTSNWINAHPDARPSFMHIWSLTVSRDRIARLNAALRAAKAGTLTDCSLNFGEVDLQTTPTEQSPEPTNLPDVVFVWFGRGQRTNSFTARKRSEDVICPSGIWELLSASNLGQTHAIFEPPVSFAVPLLPLVVD
jgi:hypothetical protein